MAERWLRGLLQHHVAQKAADGFGVMQQSQNRCPDRGCTWTLSKGALVARTSTTKVWGCEGILGRQGDLGKSQPEALAWSLCGKDLSWPE